MIFLFYTFVVSKDFFSSLFHFMKNSIQNFVFKFRAEKNITQEALAQKVGVTRQTIIAIEKGNYIPSVQLALKLAHFFKKPVEEVFSLQ